MSPNDDFAGFEIWTKPVGGPGTVESRADELRPQRLSERPAVSNDASASTRSSTASSAAATFTRRSSRTKNTHIPASTISSPAPPKSGSCRAVPGEPSKIEQGTAGLCCVWAEENTRESIFDAMVRRETWATSGHADHTCECSGVFHFGQTSPGDREWVVSATATACRWAATSSLPARKSAPRLMIAASKDPNSGNLDRVQVIKGWVDATGKTHDKIYDVAWSGDRRIGRGRQIAGGRQHRRHQERVVHEHDRQPGTDHDLEGPGLRPGRPGLLLRQGPRDPDATLVHLRRKGARHRPAEGFPATIQERAWSSPIWYRP